MHILLLLFLVGCGFAAKSGWDNAKSERGKSRDARVKEAAKRFPDGALPKSRHKAVAAKHTAGWWTRELLGGFPVTRTGVHAGWLAHSTESEHQKALRDEARTHHLQTRADYQPSRAEHKRRQQELRDQILKRTGPKASRSAVQQAAAAVKEDVRTAPAAEAPDDAIWRWDDPLDDEAVPHDVYTDDDPLPPRPAADDLAEHLKAPMPDPRLGYCGACGHHGTLDDPVVGVEGATVPIHASHTTNPESGFYGHPLTSDDNEWPTGRKRTDQHGPRAAANGTTPAPSTGGTTVSDTTYTDVLDKAKKYAADAETDAQTVGERRRELEQIADELQELDVDNDSLGELLELASLHARAEEIHKEIQDRAGAVPTGLQNRHGGVNEAAADQPVKMAHRGFYGQQ